MTTQTLGEVTANITLAPGTHILRVRAPGIARHAAAGQFVHVRCAQGSAPLLRRPCSVMRLSEGGASTAADEIALLVAVVGQGSALLAASRVGDWLDLLGPLGHGFALHPKAQRILLVGGGVGIAPLLTLAHEALERDLAVTMLFGARTGAQVFPPALLPPEIEYVVHTDDGAVGLRGFVTESVPGLRDWADQLFACGPEPMLRALARTLRDGQRPVPRSSPPWAQVSLEQHMGCAMGACYGCVVDTVAGRQRVCRDGPVFDLFEVEWW